MVAKEIQFIKPGPIEITKLPFRDLVDESKSDIFKQYREPYVGKVIFSDEWIPYKFEKSILKNELSSLGKFMLELFGQEL